MMRDFGLKKNKKKELIIIINKMNLLQYFKWRYQKRKFHLKDETELSQQEQKELLEVEISNGSKIKVKEDSKKKFNKMFYI